MMTNTPFSENWSFPSEVKSSLGAAFFETAQTNYYYSTGRPKFITKFYSAENKAILATRDSMELISKRTGNPYIVCRSRETPPKPRVLCATQ